MRIGDAILSINDETISNLTHDQVIKKLREVTGDQVTLKVQFLDDMAPYLHSASGTTRSSTTSIVAPAPTSFTLPTSSSIRIRRRQQQNRMSAEYPSGYHRPSKQQQRLSVMLSNQQKVSKQEQTNRLEFWLYELILLIIID